MVFLWPSPKPLCFQQSWGLWGRLHGVATGLQKGRGGCRVGSRSFRRGAVEVASGAQIPPAVRGAMVAHLPDAPRRRLNTKQSRPPAFPRPGAADVWAKLLRGRRRRVVHELINNSDLSGVQAREKKGSSHRGCTSGSASSATGSSTTPLRNLTGGCWIRPPPAKCKVGCRSPACE